MAKKKIVRGALSGVKDAVIKDLIEKGHTYSQMSKLLGCGYHSIYDRVRILGLSDKVAKEDLKKIVRKKSKAKRKPRCTPRTGISKSRLHNLLITKGFSGEEAAAEIGCSASTVSRRAVELGIRNSNRRRAKKRVKAHLNGGMTIEDVEELDCLNEGNSKIEGFIPHEGFVYVILENGLGFRFKGEFDLISKTQLREDIRKKHAEAIRIAKIAGLVR